ncbi:DNA starvation/stationary phase protection protein [Pullulanibacillus sp. KACC 23026]|uniref:Dps family protein n=1 Tax=Pullulanibacillus sp. KACC 23026 TaxID=3028315 RepID=UPI0023AFF7B6|nr:DNA starvation/stationary phase protection protein [Pullulanibacillus sp. KACC 23026]WEG11965.1 DNA starvation/stationary phase protection protein [Pullulanibacillus sp. KACC 23026]
MENQKLINFLNQELSNFYVLHVKLHRYHWYIQGHHFFNLHALFESLFEEMAERIDTLAERILAIGGKPLATMSKFLDEATIKEAQADVKEDEVISHLESDLSQIVKEVKETGFSLTDEAKDKPTEDLLIGLVGDFEKHLWMLQAYQAKR